MWRFGRVEVKFGKPMDFSRFEGLAGNRFIERAVIDEVMYELMRLGGQEYVDLYAADVKDNGGNVTKPPARMPETAAGCRQSASGLALRHRRVATAARVRSATSPIPCQPPESPRSPTSVGPAGQLTPQRCRRLPMFWQQGDRRPHHERDPGQADRGQQRCCRDGDHGRSPAPRRAHTQWCDHDTGETTRPNIATQIRASTGWPGPQGRRAAHTVSASTTKQASVHSANRSPSPSPSRASAPAMFWLVFSVAVPIRSVLRTVSVQYSRNRARPGRTRSAWRPPPTPRRSATRTSRRSMKYKRNTAGVSFERDRQAEQHAARPSRLAGHAVGDDQRHQHHVDLAEVEVGPDRFQVDPAGATVAAASQQRRSQAGSPEAVVRGHTSARSARSPSSDQQQQCGQGDRGAGDRQRQPGEQGEHDGRQRRIGERQVQPAAVWNMTPSHTAAGRPARLDHPCGTRRCRSGTGCPPAPPAGPGQRRQGEQLEQRRRRLASDSPRKQPRGPPITHVAEQTIGGFRRVGWYPGHDTRRSA